MVRVGWFLTALLLPTPLKTDFARYGEHIALTRITTL